MSAALRVAYIVASADWIEPIVDLKLATTLGNSAFAAAALHAFLLEGGYRRHLDMLRPRLAAATTRTLTRVKSLGLAPWTEPRSGMFLWAELPDGLDAAEVARAAQEDGVLFAPGRSFSSSRKWRGFMRFNVAASADPHAFDGLERAMERSAKR